MIVVRYLNVDYALASTFAKDIAAGIKDVVFTYDIGCQWGKNLSQRLKTYPHAPLLDLSTLRSYRIAVPKFHLISHGASCQTKFNLAFMDGVGMTHGEGVETIWSHSTSLATWSRENGPAARRLILDDHWNGWNWSKLVGLREYTCLRAKYTFAHPPVGSQLKKMLERAWKSAGVQREAADSMAATWSEFSPGWKTMLAAYKKNNKSKPNPFEAPDPGKFHASVTSRTNLSFDRRCIS